MDYRELLQQYMRHVSQQEGVTFVDGPENWSSGKITEEGWAELWKIAGVVTKMGGALRG